MTLNGQKRWAVFSSYKDKKMRVIHGIALILLCLGSDWEVLFARFQPKTGVFVRYLQFVVYFVNFLQDVLLRIGCIASVHS